MNLRLLHQVIGEAMGRSDPEGGSAVVVRINGALFRVSGVWTDAVDETPIGRLILDLGQSYVYQAR